MPAGISGLYGVVNDWPIGKSAACRAAGDAAPVLVVVGTGAGVRGEALGEGDGGVWLSPLDRHVVGPGAVHVTTNRAKPSSPVRWGDGLPSLTSRPSPRRQGDVDVRERLATHDPIVVHVLLVVEHQQRHGLADVRVTLAQRRLQALGIVLLDADRQVHGGVGRVGHERQLRLGRRPGSAWTTPAPGTCRRRRCRRTSAVLAGRARPRTRPGCRRTARGARRPHDRAVGPEDRAGHVGVTAEHGHRAPAGRSGRRGAGTSTPRASTGTYPGGNGIVGSVSACCGTWASGSMVDVEATGADGALGRAGRREGESEAHGHQAQGRQRATAGSCQRHDGTHLLLLGVGTRSVSRPGGDSVERCHPGPSDGRRGPAARAGSPQAGRADRRAAAGAGAAGSPVRGSGGARRR